MFTAAKKHDDPFDAVDLDVTFTAPDGKTVRVPAFWAGGDVWKVRYASPQVGAHSYRTTCSDPDDAGLNGRVGAIKIRPYEGDNPLYKHGPIRVAADHRHFEYADGTPFFWLGDTWWMGLCERLHGPRSSRALAADRVRQGVQRRADRGRPLPGHAGLRRARPQRGRLPLGEGLQPYPTRNTSTRPTNGSFYLADQGYRRPASSGRGAITCPGWASRR